MKGDATKAQQQIDTQGGRAQDYLSGLQSNLGYQTNDYRNLWQGATTQAQNDYGNIMSGYQNFMNQPYPSSGLTGWSPTLDRGKIDRALSGYEDFANTGGYSASDIQNLRARGIAPTRAIYQHGQDELQRARGLSGGTMTNYGAASAKMAREAAQQIGDQNVNVNAALAQAVQQGKLAGLGGLTSASLGQEQMGLMGSQLDLQAKLAAMQNETQNRGLNLGALEGQRGLYGTTPGMANMYGNQLLGSQGQQLTAAGLQNQLGLGLIGAQIDRSRIPSNYQQALGNIGGTMGLIGRGANMWSGMNPGSAAGLTGGTALPGSTTGLAGSGFGNAPIGTETVGSQSVAGSNSPSWWKGLLGGGGGGSSNNPYAGNPFATLYNPYVAPFTGGGDYQMSFPDWRPRTQAF